MHIVTNTLRVIARTEHDPGVDDCSYAPVRSRRVVEGVVGEVVLNMTVQCPGETDEFLAQELDLDGLKITEWSEKWNGDIVTLTPTEWDADNWEETE